MDRLALPAAMKPIQEAWGETLALAIENPDQKLATLGAGSTDWDLWSRRAVPAPSASPAARVQMNQLSTRTKKYLTPTATRANFVLCQLGNRHLVHWVPAERLRVTFMKFPIS
jgi:hypothetical protein